MDPTLLRTETIRRFASWQLAPHEALPLIESQEDLRPKRPAEVAARAVAARYIVAACFGAPGNLVREHLERFALASFLTPEESKFVDAAAMKETARNQHSWLTESIQFLAWYMHLQPLDHFADCSDTLAKQLPGFGADPADFIARAKLRPFDELQQEADTLYMLHWCAVEYSLTGIADARVVLPRFSSRRHAADWAMGTAETWDDVVLDT